MADTYAARIVDVPGQGLRLAPTDDAAVPEQPNEAHLLALAIALALGAAGYEHHPEPRDPAVQTMKPCWPAMPSCRGAPVPPVTQATAMPGQIARQERQRMLCATAPRRAIGSVTFAARPS